MQSMTLPQRVALADQIRALRQKVGEDVTEEFLSRHPDWLERYGEHARHFGIEDACFHLDFLAGAVEAASLDSFRDYARWTVGMLQARGIGENWSSRIFVKSSRPWPGTFRPWNRRRWLPSSRPVVKPSPHRPRRPSQPQKGWPWSATFIFRLCCKVRESPRSRWSSKPSTKAAPSLTCTSTSCRKRCMKSAGFGR